MAKKPPPPAPKNAIDLDKALIRDQEFAVSVAWTPSANTNHSGITHDQDKANEEPEGWAEIDGYEEDWETGEQSTVRWFNGPWGGRKAFAEWLLGYSYTIPIQTSNPTYPRMLRRVVPAQHPEYPWQYAVRVKFKGQGAIANNTLVYMIGPDGKPVIGPDGVLPQNIPMIGYYDSGDNGVGDRRSCVAQVVYRALDYEIYNDFDFDHNAMTEINRYVTRAETYALRTLPVPTGQLKFVEGPVGTIVPSSSAQRLFPTKEVTYVWHNVPDVPEAAIAACEGHLNSKTFDPPLQITGLDGKPVQVGGLNSGGYAAGTLLMHLPPEKKRLYRDVTGDVTWTITYKLAYNAFGWNRFPYSDNRFYLAHIFDGNTGADTGSPFYDSADFNQLFTQPPGTGPWGQANQGPLG